MVRFFHVSGASNSHFPRVNDAAEPQARVSFYCRYHLFDLPRTVGRRGYKCNAVIVVMSCQCNPVTTKHRRLAKGHEYTDLLSMSLPSAFPKDRLWAQQRQRTRLQFIRRAVFHNLHDERKGLRLASLYTVGLLEPTATATHSSRPKLVPKPELSIPNCASLQVPGIENRYCTTHTAQSPKRTTPTLVPSIKQRNNPNP